MRIYILRKHPVVRQFNYHLGIPVEPFMIAGTFATRAECVAAANVKNPRSQAYVYTVGVVNLKEKTK
jgi:hypothetical protein